MLNVGTGPDVSKPRVATPRLSEMLLRVFRADGQGRPARTVELFGFYDLTLGILILVAPLFVARWLHLPPLSAQAEDYVRLVGLLVSGLGMLYIISGRLNSQKLRLRLPARSAPRSRHHVHPLAARHPARSAWLSRSPSPTSVDFFGRCLPGVPKLESAVHPRRPPRESPQVSSASPAASCATPGHFIQTEESSPARSDRSIPQTHHLPVAAGRLAGTSVLLRIGMGLMKSGMPGRIAKLIPDAPSITGRFFTPSSPGDFRLQRRPGEDLDLLCTAGGDRLWKLILNLATGGRSTDFSRFNYFQNTYFADTRYRIEGGDADVWIRLVPETGTAPPPNPPADAAAREAGLTEAVASAPNPPHRGAAHRPALTIHSSPSRRSVSKTRSSSTRRRFTSPRSPDEDSRRSASSPTCGRAPIQPVPQSRPATAPERAQREHESIPTRLERYLGSPQRMPLTAAVSSSELTPAASAIVPRRHPRLRAASLALARVRHRSSVSISPFA